MDQAEMVSTPAETTGVADHQDVDTPLSETNGVAQSDQGGPSPQQVQRHMKQSSTEPCLTRTRNQISPGSKNHRSNHQVLRLLRYHMLPRLLQMPCHRLSSQQVSCHSDSRYFRVWEFDS
jgi:hypothetical protein